MIEMKSRTKIIIAVVIISGVLLVILTSWWIEFENSIVQGCYNYRASLINRHQLSRSNVSDFNDLCGNRVGDL